MVSGVILIPAARRAWYCAGLPEDAALAEGWGAVPFVQTVNKDKEKRKAAEAKAQGKKKKK